MIRPGPPPDAPICEPCGVVLSSAPAGVYVDCDGCGAAYLSQYAATQAEPSGGDIEAYQAAHAAAMERGYREEEAMARGGRRDFLESLYALAAASRDNELLDRSYDALDDLLLNGMPLACDAYLAEAEVERLGLVGSIGFLTVTLPAAADLPSRSAFGARVRAMVSARRPDEAEALLRGLL